MTPDSVSEWRGATRPRCSPSPAQRKTAEVADALATFDALIAESADLQRLVRSPVFSAAEQLKALGALLDTPASPASPPISSGSSPSSAACSPSAT